MFIEHLAAQAVPAMERSRAAARLRHDWPSGNAPTTRVRRRISRMIRSSGLLTGMRFLVLMFGCDSRVVAYGATIGTEAPGARRCGQADPYHEPRARVVSWPPLRLARLRRERESVVVVSPAAPVMCLAGGAHATRDWHRYPPNFRGGGVLGRRQAPTCGPR